jgi:uncharacterized protein with PIN domain
VAGQFFFDRSMGKSIPRAFALLGLDVVVHDDHFGQATPDDVWLAVVGEQGWIVITKDDRIRFNEAERAALIAQLRPHATERLALADGTEFDARLGHDRPDHRDHPETISLCSPRRRHVRDRSLS